MTARTTLSPAEYLERLRERKRLSNRRWLDKPGNRERNRAKSRECHRRLSEAKRAASD